MNSKQKGDITELEIILAFTKLGYNVLLPYGDRNRYDLVVDTGNKFIRIQCKTATKKDNGNYYIISCKSSHRKNGKCVSHPYFKNEIDYFATTINKKQYLIPVEECNSSKILRISSPKNSQKKNITFADNYLLEEVVKKW